jgi:hypothetical protein
MIRFTLDTRRPGQTTAERQTLRDHPATVQALKGLGLRLDTSASLVREAVRTGNPVRRVLTTGTVITVGIEVTK